MGEKLQKLFDFQCFQQNSRLAAILDDVAKRDTNVLTDDDLAFVSAAGEANRLAEEDDDDA